MDDINIIFNKLNQLRVRFEDKFIGAQYLDDLVEIQRTLNRLIKKQRELLRKA